jgi:hypothetical protein
MGCRSATLPATGQGRRAAWLLAILGLLILSCAPPPGSDSAPRTSGSLSFITARSLEQLVEQSTVIAIARLEEAEEARDLTMFPGGPPQPQDDVYVLGQAYRLDVERYLKGEGPDAIRVVQAEAWGLRDTLTASTSPQEEIEAMRQEALERHQFVPFAPDTAYLLFLNPLWRDEDSGYLTGTRHPYRFVLAEDSQASPDSPWDGAQRSFPPRPAEELLGEVERLIEETP